MKTKLLLWGVVILIICWFFLAPSLIKTDISEEMATENAEDTTWFMSTGIGTFYVDSDTCLAYNDTSFEHFSDFTSNFTICEADTVFIEGADVVIIKNKDTEVYLYETE